MWRIKTSDTFILIIMKRSTWIAALGFLFCFLASCSYSPVKSVGTYNYDAKQMAVGVANPPKDAMVIESKEVDSDSIVKKPSENTENVENPENDKLRAENESLKREIQNLRSLLATPSTQTSTSQEIPTTASEKVAPQGDQKQSTGFWLTSSSKKRHNSSCRYYKTSNGSECGPNDGIPCKLCGG
jgi:hypothetical protein